MSETLIKMLEHIGLPNPYISSTGWIWCDYDDAYSVACCEDNSWIRIKSPLVALPRDESEQSTLLRFLLSKNVGMAARCESYLTLDGETSSVVLIDRVGVDGITNQQFAYTFERFMNAYEGWMVHVGECVRMYNVR